MEDIACGLICHYVFLPAVIFVGVMTSYEDIRSSRVRNLWVGSGLAYVFAVYLAAFALTVFLKEGHPSFRMAACLLLRFDGWALNLLVGAAVAYGLWFFNLWGAGDAKLFIFYCAAVPASLYPLSFSIGRFPFFFFSLAVFLPSMVFLLVGAFYYFGKKAVATRGKTVYAASLIRAKIKEFRPLGFLKHLIGFSVFFLFFRILKQEARHWVRVFPDQNLLFLVLLFGFKKLARFFEKHTIFVIVMFAAGLAYLFWAGTSSRPLSLVSLGSFFGRGFLVMTAFMALRTLTRTYVEAGVKKTMPFAPWMFLGVLIVWAKGSGLF